jgi:succinoglycan biosynthesis protein ExoM
LVVVLTYRRPIQLNKCLISISTAALPGWSDAPRLLVVDNDPSTDSVQIPTALTMSCDVLKFGQGRRIAAARQAGLDHARAAAFDYLAFVDDDEIVSIDWLSHLLLCSVRTNSAAVAGPVQPGGLLPRQEHLHARARHRTGTVVESAGAGNLLLRIATTKGIDFDTTWSLPGGEDTEFTMRLTKSGHTITWCDEAAVSEPVNPDRLGYRWLTRRFFMNGRILARSHLRVHGQFANHAFLRAPIALVVTFLWPAHLLHGRFGRFILEKGVRQLGYCFELIALRKKESL